MLMQQPQQFQPQQFQQQQMMQQQMMMQQQQFQQPQQPPTPEPEEYVGANGNTYRVTYEYPEQPVPEPYEFVGADGKTYRATYPGSQKAKPEPKEKTVMEKMMGQMMQKLIVKKMFPDNDGGGGDTSACDEGDTVCIANAAVTESCDSIMNQDAGFGQGYSFAYMIQIMYKCDPTAASWIGPHLGLLSGSGR
jgi:hypothetical protein